MFNQIQERSGGLMSSAGGVFRFGTGILGRSAVVLVVLLLLFGTVAFRLHSEELLIGLVVLASIIFIVWFFNMLAFAKADPASALLEGAEWRRYQTFEPRSKDHLPIPEELRIEAAPPRTRAKRKATETHELQQPLDVDTEQDNG